MKKKKPAQKPINTAVKEKFNQIQAIMRYLQSMMDDRKKDLEKLQRECKHPSLVREFDGMDWYTECQDCGAVL